jgi:hypothetical protein
LVVVAERTFPDEWLVPTVTTLLGPDLVERLRAEAPPASRLWDLVVSRKHVTDDQVLTALSSRHRVSIADLATVEPAAKSCVPEALARRYRIVPVRATDISIEVATADPYDMDVEKGVAFATGREVRMSLASPARIAQLTEELYRPDTVVDRLAEEMGQAVDVRQIAEEDPAAGLQISAEEASQRPIVRLMDRILSEAVLSRWSRASRSSATSTSPTGCGRRTAARAWPSPACRWTCAFPRFPRRSARRPSSGSWMRGRRCCPWTRWGSRPANSRPSGRCWRTTRVWCW